ncbi:hypothetical protein MMC10_006830 [Thelotrema lepadinum]|nr:hypothetical protein [Thelotrema lepadinum]
MRFTAPTILTLLSVTLSTNAYYTPLYTRDYPDTLNLDLSERDVQENSVYARAISALITDILAARDAEAEAGALPSQQAQTGPTKQMMEEEPRSWITPSSQPSKGKKGKSSSKKSSSRRRSAEPDPEPEDSSAFFGAVGLETRSAAQTQTVNSWYPQLKGHQKSSSGKASSKRRRSVPTQGSGSGGKSGPKSTSSSKSSGVGGGKGGENGGGTGGSSGGGGGSALQLPPNYVVPPLPTSFAPPPTALSPGPQCRNPDVACG